MSAMANKKAKRHKIGVYTVVNGKIVQEEFMYGGAPGA